MRVPGAGFVRQRVCDDCFKNENVAARKEIVKTVSFLFVHFFLLKKSKIKKEKKNQKI